MSMRRWLPIALLGFACSAVAGQAPKGPLHLTDASFMEIQDFVLGARGRPNEEYRFSGLKSYKTGHFQQAAQQFKIAALYADKYSQHYLSLMSWHGVGVPRDHVQAYIWSDLAAERGSKGLLVLREKMWAGLSAEERQQVMLRGEAAYAKFGDAAAKPRAEARIRRFAREMTGSRVGYRNQRMDVMGRPINGVMVTEVGGNDAAYAMAEAAHPDELYGKEGGLRRLVDYWQLQDRILEGNVEVGPLQNMTEHGQGDGGMDS